jgi:hypothetical protein
MKLNINLKQCLLPAALALLLAVPSQAQTPATQDRAGFFHPVFGSPGAPIGGLVGQTYSSLDFAFLRYRGGLPRILHQYGATFNSAYAPGLDTGVQYHYTSGKDTGLKYLHEGLATVTGYTPLPWAKAFGEVAGGWAWNKTLGVKEDGFAWRVTGGLELGAPAPFALTPFVGYGYTRGYREHVWNYGAKATIPLTEGMSLTAGGDVDGNHTTAYRFSLNIHF